MEKIIRAIVETVLESESFTELLKPVVNEIMIKRNHIESIRTDTEQVELDQEKEPQPQNGDYAKLKVKLQNKIQESENLKSQLHEKENNLDNKNNEIINLRSELEDKKQESENLKSQLHEKENNLDGKNNEITNLRSELEDKIQESENLKSQLHEKENNLDNKNNEITNLRSELEDKIQESKNLKSQLHEKENNLDNKNNEITNLNSELERSNQKISMYENQFKEHRRLFEIVKNNRGLQYGHEASDFETFVLTTGNENFLKKIWEHFRSKNISNNSNSRYWHELIELYIKCKEKSEDSTGEIIVPKEGDPYNDQRHDSPKGSGRTIAKVILPGYRFKNENLVKPLVETAK